MVQTDWNATGEFAKPSLRSSQPGELTEGTSESQPHTLSLCVEGGTGEKTQRKLPARIFKMSSRCGHRCGTSPLLFVEAKLVCVVTDISASLCPWCSCSWHDNWTTFIYGLEGFKTACLPWKCSSQPVPDRRQGINTRSSLVPGLGLSS